MSKRLDPKLWMDVATFIDKDGLCAYCRRPLPQPLNNRDVRRREWASINHIDSNEADWRVENLNLMHICCNNSYRAEMQRKAKLQFLLNLATRSDVDASPTSSTVSGERAPIPSMTVPKFRIVPGQSDSFSNRKNAECMPLYYKLFFSRLGLAAKSGAWEAPDGLNNSLAFSVGEVPKSTRDYMNALTSDVGPAEVMDHPTTNKPIVVFRKQEYAVLSVDELMQLFPPEGLRTVSEQTKMALLKVAEDRMQTRPTLETEPTA